MKPKSSKIRIVHLASSYPPNLGGLEKVVQILANIQYKKDFDVKVITSNKGKECDKQIDMAKVVRLRHFNFANTTIMPRLLLKLLRIDKSSIVHLHVTQAYLPDLVWLVSKIKGYKYIAHIHIDAKQEGRLGFMLTHYKRHILKKVLNSASYVVVFTKEQKNEVSKKYSIRFDKIKVIPNGVEDTFFYKKKRSLHYKPRLLFVGRLDAQKNLFFLLEALDGISDKFYTTIVGDGELSSKLKTRSQRLGLKNVKFTGRLDGARLTHAYEYSDIFVLTSEREGMPLVLLEAMAMKLPVVATKVKGISGLVKDGINGKLVDYGDIKSLQNALIEVSSNQVDYSIMSKNASDISKHYSWDNIFIHFEELYLDIKNEV